MSAKRTLVEWISLAATNAHAAYGIGRQVLRGGDAQPWPEDLKAAFERLPIEQQAMLRAGARSDIDQRFGQNRNDLSALLKIIGGENDYNRGNMQTLFGKEATGRVVSAAEREQVFANTRNAITAGSRTAPMQAGSKMIDEATAARQPMFPKDTSILGLILNAGEHAVRKGTGMMAGMANDTARGQLQNFFSLRGAARDQAGQGLLAALAGRARSGDALQSILANPATVPALLAARRRNDR